MDLPCLWLERHEFEQSASLVAATKMETAHEQQGLPHGYKDSSVDAFNTCIVARLTVRVLPVSRHVDLLLPMATAIF